MGISASLESKSSGSLSLEEKDNGLTWDEATMTWDEANGTWENPLRPSTLESKTKVDLTLESK